MAVFDPVVFDPGIFDATDPIPTLLKVRVYPRHRMVKGGQGVTIVIYIVNVDTTPGRVFTLDPSVLPQIALYGPDGSVVQAATDMVSVSPGEYRYQRDTSVNDTSGPYSAVFTASNGDRDMVTPKMVVYSII